MSGKDDAIHVRRSFDRRVSKTRAMLLASFDQLLLARGYDDVSVRALTEHADVGRSTFYEHFEGKDDLLEQSLARPLAALAAATQNEASSIALLEVLTHLRAQRVLARALLQGSARAIMIRVLASKLEGQLAALVRRSATPPIAALPFLAASLAHGQLGVIEAWLGGDDRCDVQTAARVLRATTRAGFAAMFGET